MKQDRTHSTALRHIIPALLLTFLLLAETASPRRNQDHVPPVVETASVPFYPPLARVAHIEGVVKLRITSDGSNVSDVSVLSGPPMLVSAAAENVRTWKFRDHSPTTFEVTFRYRMLSESKCEIDNGTVTLNLPGEVEIAAAGVKTCP